MFYLLKVYEKCENEGPKIAKISKMSLELQKIGTNMRVIYRQKQIFK